MFKVSCCTVAVLVLVGLVGFSGEASAQNTPVILDNVPAWWNHLNCSKKLHAVNAITDLDTAHPVLTGEEAFSDDGNDSSNDSEREWCHAWGGLGQNQQRAVDAGAKQALTDGGIVTKASDRIFDVATWWSNLTNPEGRRLAIGVNLGTAVAYPDLPATTAALVDAAFYALMGETPAPAFPLVGLGLLGFLLAARGAYLRRRSR